MAYYCDTTRRTTYHEYTPHAPACVLYAYNQRVQRETMSTKISITNEPRVVAYHFANLVDGKEVVNYGMPSGYVKPGDSYVFDEELKNGFPRDLCLITELQRPGDSDPIRIGRYCGMPRMNITYTADMGVKPITRLAPPAPGSAAARTGAPVVSQAVPGQAAAPALWRPLPTDGAAAKVDDTNGIPSWIAWLALAIIVGLIVMWYRRSRVDVIDSEAESGEYVEE